MIVYQIRVYGGEREDKYNYAVAAYLSKQRAEEELVVLNDEADEETKRYNEHCNNCYDLEGYYCPYKDIVYDDDDMEHEYPYCANEVSLPFLDATFYIEEIEVIE